MEDVDKVLAFYRKECFSTVCACVRVLFSSEHWSSREFQQNTTPPSWWPPSLKAQNALGTPLLPWVPLLTLPN